MNELEQYLYLDPQHMKFKWLKWLFFFPYRWCAVINQNWEGSGVAPWHDVRGGMTNENGLMLFGIGKIWQTRVGVDR